MKHKLTFLAVLFGLTFTAAAQTPEPAATPAGSVSAQSTDDQAKSRRSKSTRKTQGKWFDKLDTNSDGSLSREEFARMRTLRQEQGSRPGRKARPTTSKGTPTDPKGPSSDVKGAGADAKTTGETQGASSDKEKSPTSGSGLKDSPKQDPNNTTPPDKHREP